MAGIECPKCGGVSSKVKNTYREKSRNRRRRVCKSCFAAARGRLRLQPDSSRRRLVERNCPGRIARCLQHPVADEVVREFVIVPEQSIEQRTD